MADVAAKVGVSRALVSLVFRNEPGAGPETREKIFAAAAELGYQPDTAARMLARSRSRTIGVMVTVRQPFHADLVEGMYAKAESLGYDILLSATAPTRGERKAIDALLSHRCEALILLQHGPKPDPTYMSELVSRVPVVVVGRGVPGSGADSVHSAEAKGVRQAVDHLVELGHRSIIHIDGGAGPGSADRRRAYRTSMRRHGLSDEVRVISGDHTEDSGIRAAKQLVTEKHLPTAVLASNDRCAFGLLGTLREVGVKVPDEISVVGYDDSHISHLSYVDLTTVHQDAEGIAELSVQAVVERLDNPDIEPRELVLEPKLVVRGTTAPPRLGS